MAGHATDDSILKHIEGLVHEERRLDGEKTLADDDRARHEKIRTELDQCWDLLRQRRARREFNQDPDAAKVRPGAVVEDYEG